MASQKTVLVVVLSIVGGLLLVVLVVCGIAGVFVAQGVTVARKAAETERCKNNLKQIIIAMQIHHDQRGDFPPLYITDAQGNRLHSWRVLLLPYMEQGLLFRRIRLNEPWDSEYNRQFHSQMPEFYRCPSSPHDAASGLTSYFSVEGQNAPLQPVAVDTSKPDTIAHYRSATNFGSLIRGSSNQVMVFEANGYAVNWMQPDDPTFAELRMSKDPNSEGAGSNHAELLNVAYADGRVRSMSSDLPIEELLQKLKTRPE